MKELNQSSKADEIGEKWLALSKTAGPLRWCLRMGCQKDLSANERYLVVVREGTMKQFLWKLSWIMIKESIPWERKSLNLWREVLQFGEGSEEINSEYERRCEETFFGTDTSKGKKILHIYMYIYIFLSSWNKLGCSGPNVTHLDMDSI